MRHLKNLVIGELHRLVTYKILPISVLTSMIWVIIFLFISKEEARNFAPLLIFVDVGMMLMILIGASLHLEKQEGTIKSMMVMPVSLFNILMSKIISSMVLGLESGIVISLSLFLIHGITINYLLLFIFIVISCLSHAAIGYLLALLSKDFTSMLVLLMGYIFVFALPTMLYSFGVIGTDFEWLLLFSPSHSANTLLASSVHLQFDTWKILFSSFYLLILGMLLIRYLVYPRFKNYALRG